MVRDVFEDVAAGDALDPDADLFDRARAVLRVLRRLAVECPVVVAIDDVQWCDPISARALRYALRRLDDPPVAASNTPPGALVMLALPGTEMPFSNT